MEHIDLKKLEIAIKYIERMADGKNPVNNQVLDKDTVVNNPNIIRCFFFILDILKGVYEKEMKAEKKRESKAQFPFAVLNEYIYEKDKSISHIMLQMNDLVKEENTEKVTYNKVVRWLKASGYLMEKYSEELGKTVTVPTLKGRGIGIYCEMRESSKGNKYLVNMYDKNAQFFIVDNMKKIYDVENVV